MMIRVVCWKAKRASLIWKVAIFYRPKIHGLLNVVYRLISILIYQSRFWIGRLLRILKLILAIFLQLATTLLLLIANFMMWFENVGLGCGTLLQN